MSEISRRDVLGGAALVGGCLALSSQSVFAQQAPSPQKEEPAYFPVPVDESLFAGINRVKNPAHETALEQLHVPVIAAPEKVKAGEIFEVQVTIGKTLHPMGPEHWIEYLQVNIGNEPAGTLLMRSHGYIEPKGAFHLKLGEDLKGKKISLVVQIKCNLHGIWENQANIEVL